MELVNPKNMVNKLLTNYDMINSVYEFLLHYLFKIYICVMLLWHILISSTKCFLFIRSFLLRHPATAASQLQQQLAQSTTSSIRRWYSNSRLNPNRTYAKSMAKHHRTLPFCCPSIFKKSIHME